MGVASAAQDLSPDPAGGGAQEPMEPQEPSTLDLLGLPTSVKKYGLHIGSSSIPRKFKRFFHSIRNFQVITSRKNFIKIHKNHEKS